MKDELSSPNVNGYKVIYLESIIETNKGNNPHIGHGYYDNGEEEKSPLNMIASKKSLNDFLMDQMAKKKLSLFPHHQL